MLNHNIPINNLAEDLGQMWAPDKFFPLYTLRKSTRIEITGTNLIG